MDDGEPCTCGFCPPDPVDGSKCCMGEVACRKLCSEEAVQCVIKLQKFHKLVWDKVSYF